MNIFIDKKTKLRRQYEKVFRSTRLRFFELKSNKKYTNVVETLYQIRENVYPEYIEIETMSGCNGTCDFCCKNKNIDKEKSIKMPESMYFDIIDQLAEINYSGHIYPVSSNEPFRDVRLPVFVSYARNKLPKCKITIYCNDTIINLDKFLKIIPDLDRLFIDIYLDQAVFDTTTLTKFDWMPKNIYDIYKHVEKSSDVYKNKVFFNVINRNAVRHNRGGTSPNAPLSPFIKSPCNLPFRFMSIKPSGIVAKCCNDPFGNPCLGNVGNERIMDIWFGKRYMELRKAMLEGRDKVIECYGCDCFYDMEESI